VEQIPLDSYRVFCEVARAGSISAAAKVMYLTQPAVSMAVKQLETQLGKPLFSRSVKGMALTAEGEVLHSYLKRAFELIASGEEKYRAMTELREGEIKIGAGDTILSYYLLPFIERFNETHPGITIKATNRTTSETVNMLKTGSVDVGFINLPFSDDALTITPCMDIHDCLVAGSKYARLSERGLRIDELDDWPLMLLENESNSRRYLNEWAHKHNRALKPAIELGSYDLLLQFAEINLGLTFAVREFLSGNCKPQGLTEIPLTPAIPARSIGLAVLKGVRLSIAAGEFVKTIR
jgi:DNA-binding transcriptional LysR family regulator